MTTLRRILKDLVRYFVNRGVRVSLKLPQPKARPHVSPAASYRKWLKKEVASPEYKSDKWTYCNTFTSEVCLRYGWELFSRPKQMRAGEMVEYMQTHPKIWKLLDSHDEARHKALAGMLVIAGKKSRNTPGSAVWMPSGHVCIVAPEKKLLYSGKWKQWVAKAANVGSNNWYGKALSWAFKDQPQLFLYLG